MLKVKIRRVRLYNLKLCKVVKNICYKQFFHSIVEENVYKTRKYRLELNKEFDR